MKLPESWAMTFLWEASGTVFFSFFLKHLVLEAAGPAGSVRHDLRVTWQVLLGSVHGCALPPLSPSRHHGQPVLRHCDVTLHAPQPVPGHPDPHAANPADRGLLVR